MSYFRELPDLEYQSFDKDKNSSLDYITVKNIFRRVKIRDDLSYAFKLFNKYEIRDGARPDTVAEELYGKADLDWVVLISAGITNIKTQWPLSDGNLYNYAENKYGFSGMNAIRFYETREVKDSSGRLILPKGKVVNENFTIPDPDTIYTVPTNTLNPVVGITNFEYEVRLNDKKRTIYALKKVYLQQFLADIRKIMYYDKSSQYVDSRLIRTENTINTTT